MICVYVLKSLKDDKKYIGSTSRGHQTRLLEHNSGKSKSTRHRRPFIIIGFQECETIKEASELEKKYKRSNGALQRAIKNKQFKIINIGA